MPSTLHIKQRIKSVKNTRQITKAMEKVSAVKMRKSQTAATKSKRYAALARHIMQNLESNVEKDIHPFFKKREIKNAAYLVISTDRGLCGSMNTRLLQAILKSIREQKFARESAKLYVMGKKARDSAVRYGYPLVADFGAVPPSPSAAFVMPVVNMLADDYLEGRIDTVYLCYTDFENILRQAPIVREILPLTKEALGEEAEEKKPSSQFLFEPSPEEVLNAMLYRILEIQVYQGILENNASEHSARMVAMKNATENASELIGELGLAYNQIRQSSITREVAEISAGRIALEQ